MENLNKIVKRYLQANGISSQFFSKYIGCEYTKCQRWFSGERKLSDEEERKALEFLRGKFLTPLDQIVTIVPKQDDEE